MVWLQQSEILDILRSFRCNIHFEIFRYYIFTILLLYLRPLILKKCKFYNVVHKNVLIKIVPPLHSSGRYLYYSCCRKMPPLISQVRQTLTGILSIIKKQRAKSLKLMRKNMRIFHFLKFSDKIQTVLLKILKVI